MKAIHAILGNQSGEYNSQDWLNFLVYCGFNIVLIEPSGWDYNNWTYSFEQEKINNLEFYERLRKSKIEL